MLIENCLVSSNDVSLNSAMSHQCPLSRPSTIDRYYNLEINTNYETQYFIPSKALASRIKNEYYSLLVESPLVSQSGSGTNRSVTLVSRFATRCRWACGRAVTSWRSRWRRNTRARHAARHTSTCGGGTIASSCPTSTAPSPGGSSSSSCCRDNRTGPGEALADSRDTRSFPSRYGTYGDRFLYTKIRFSFVGLLIDILADSSRFSWLTLWSMRWLIDVIDGLTDKLTDRFCVNIGRPPVPWHDPSHPPWRRTSTRRWRAMATASSTRHLPSPPSHVIVHPPSRSDVLGHVLPMIGKDWSQAGIANLYTAVARNGYRFLYLSARAIGQSQFTRAYLRSVRQPGNVSLPDGPLLLSPSSLFSALHRWVTTMITTRK